MLALLVVIHTQVRIPVWGPVVAAPKSSVQSQDGAAVEGTWLTAHQDHRTEAHDCCNQPVSKGGSNKDMTVKQRVPPRYILVTETASRHMGLYQRNLETARVGQKVGPGTYRQKQRQQVQEYSSRRGALMQRAGTYTVCIHLVADHFSPLSTGHPECSAVASNLPSGFMLKNRSALPLRGFTAGTQGSKQGAGTVCEFGPGRG